MGHAANGRTARSSIGRRCTRAAGSRRCRGGRSRPPARPTSCGAGWAPSCRARPARPPRSSTCWPPRCEPGLMANASGRFFGWVIGGTLPAALAADWLVSAWDQNAGMRYATPGVVGRRGGRRRLAARPARACPAGAAVGFVTGATMANFTCLAAARDAVLGRAGWDVAARRADRRARGCACSSAPSGTTRSTWRCATSGSARRELVAADDQGRMRPDALRRRARRGRGGPAIVCLQAGNVHSGAFDPFGRGDRGRPRARRLGARRRRVRAVGRGRPAPGAAHRRAGRRRLVGDRRAQDAQRARTTAASRSSPTRPRCPARWACTPATCCTPRPATRSSACRSCRGGRGACRCGRRCARSGPTASPTSSTGLVRARAGDRRRDRARSPAPRCSTTSSTRRCASRSRTTSGRAQVFARLLAEGTVDAVGERLARSQPSSGSR